MQKRTLLLLASGAVLALGIVLFAFDQLIVGGLLLLAGIAGLAYFRDPKAGDVEADIDVDTPDDSERD
ncbi:MAG TPA: hypothetical protein VNZ52_10820 [Candidatus Thermoplasmatota archaeon]|nr:hypothetical protein [Candidatus Thermoplasmatota archaeon]